MVRQRLQLRRAISAGRQKILVEVSGAVILTAFARADNQFPNHDNGVNAHPIRAARLQMDLP